MKIRIRSLAAAVLLCLTLTACGNTTDTPQPGGTMVVNPMQGKASLAEVNDAIGCSMKTPEGLTVSDEQFFVISGVYVDGKTLGQAADSSSGASDTVISPDGMWTRWFDGDMQYSLLSRETGAQDTSALYQVRDALR